MSRDTIGNAASIAFFALLLLWPAILTGHPFYIPDSASYLHGGAVGVQAVGLKFHELWQGIIAATDTAPLATGRDSHAMVDAALGGAGGTRSLVYSLAAYLLRMPGQSLWALVIVQAGAVASTIYVTMRLVAPAAPRMGQWALMIGVAALTTASWNAATAIPDIFAGIALMAIVPLALFPDRLSLLEKLFLFLLITIAVTAHASHLPIALATLGAGAVARLWIARPVQPGAARELFWLMSAPILAVAVMLSASLLAFGYPSLAPKRYPITLARSIEDGPGRLYLEKHCPTKRFAICEIFPAGYPAEHNELLWGKNGVRYRATPEQMERMRAEERPIVIGAALEHPWLQISRSARNAAHQFIRLGLRTVDFRSDIAVAADGRADLETVSPDQPGLRHAFNIIVHATLIASLILLFLFRRRLAASERAALFILAAGLIANAMVCGILSGVADRYQGRVIWTIPALAMMILLRLRSEAAQKSSR